MKLKSVLNNETPLSISSLTLSIFLRKPRIRSSAVAIITKNIKKL